MNPERARTGADSGRRALDMLFAFTEQRPTASARELADALDIPLPSVHRYIAMLRDMGLIEEGSRGRYHLTMRVAALGRAARQATPIVDIAEPFMRRLGERLGESVLLMRMIQRQPVCIHRVEAPTRFRLSFEPGQPLPRLRGASVRLLLGGLDEAARRAYVEQAEIAGELPPVNGRERFLDEVRRDSARGWAVSNEEIDEGVWAVSATVHEGGEIVGALSAPCPVFRLDDEKRDMIIDLVRKTARDLSNVL